MVDIFSRKFSRLNYSSIFVDTPCILIGKDEFKEKNKTKKHKFAEKIEPWESTLLPAGSTSIIMS